MDEIVRNVVVAAVLLVLVGGLTWSARHRSTAALLLLALSLAGGLGLGFLIPMDLLTLPADTGLGGAAGTLMLWALFAALLPAAGRPVLPAALPPIAWAVLCGALMGELGAAAVFGVSATSRTAAARLTLAAAAGALVGRMGDPALLVLSGALGLDLLRLIPVALVCALVAWPMRGDIQPEGAPDAPPVSRPLSLLVLGVGLASQLPGVAPVALGLGVLALAFLGRGRLKQAAGRIPLHMAGVLGLVMVATAAGVPALAAMGMEEIQYTQVPLLRPLLFGAGWLAALPLDSGGAGLLSLSMLDRARSLHVDGGAAVLAAGAAIGGLGPLVVAGALKQGWRILLVQGLVCGGLVWVVL